MANELYPFPHGGVLRGDLEASPGASTTVSDTETLFCPPDASFNSFRRVMIERPGQAAFIAGFKPSRGMAMGEYSITVDLDHEILDGSTVLTAGSRAGVPQADLWLRAGGFEAAYTSDADYSGVKPDNVTLSGGTNDEIITYTYKPRQGTAGSSAKLVYTEINSAGDEGRTHTLTSCRHGWTISVPSGERVTMACEGKSLATPIAKDSSPTTGSSLPDEEEVVGLGANVSLHAVADSVTYGKSGETDDASTLGALSIYDLEISSNLEIDAKPAPTGTYGIGSIRYNPGTPTATFRLDQVTFEDDFDIESFRDDREILRLTMAIANPDDDVSFIVIQFEGYITDIQGDSADGYRGAQITMQLGYPDSSSDGGGLDPAALMTLKYVTVIAAP